MPDQDVSGSSEAKRGFLEAEAKLEAARAAYEQAKRELARTERIKREAHAKLLEEGLASAQEYVTVDNGNGIIHKFPKVPTAEDLSRQVRALVLLLTYRSPVEILDGVYMEPDSEPEIT